MIERNTYHLLRLQAGLFEEYVLDIMGPPQRLEGYPWGTVWLYRTALTTHVRTTPGGDFLATYRHREPSLGGGVPQ
jgi:hypothetical protein